MDDRADGLLSCDRYDSGIAVMRTDWIEAGGAFSPVSSGPVVIVGMSKLPAVVSESLLLRVLLLLSLLPLLPLLLSPK